MKEILEHLGQPDVDPIGHFLDFIGNFFSAICSGITTIGSAIGAAAVWLANAAVDYTKFCARVGYFIGLTLYGIATNPFADLDQLVAGARKSGPEVLAFVLLGTDAGLRRGEIIALEQTDADHRRGQLTIARSDLVR